jgi:hypothetical protein
MAESGNVGDKELKKLRKDLGLDLPYYQQYLVWVWQMVSLNPGDSIFTNEPIPVALKKAIPVTLELATLAMILGLVIAVPIGVLSATHQDRCRTTSAGWSRSPDSRCRILARHARHHLRGDLVPLDAADRLRELLGVAVEEPAAVPRAGGHPGVPPVGRDACA